MAILIVSTVIVHYLLALAVSATDPCEPSLARDCFAGVHTDLAQVIDRGSARQIAIDDNYLERLCNGIDDALNCTSDIIDVDCTEADGRLRFDTWNKAFVSTYFELCDANGKDDKILIRTIIGNLDCWNATGFVQCFQDNTGLTSVQQMLSLAINKKECDQLYRSFEMCRQKQMEAPKGQCRPNETQESSLIVHHLFDIFMDSSHCRHYYTNHSKGNYSSDRINKIVASLFALCLSVCLCLLSSK